MRAVARAPSLRSQRVFAEIARELREASRRGLRVLHVSVQRDHVHMIVEAADREAIARGVQRLASRVALHVNRVIRRFGKLWRDRYHRHDLGSPRAVRNAIAYVLFNARKHVAARCGSRARRVAQLAVDALHANIELDGDVLGLDRFSSAPFFSGWAPRAGPDPALLASPSAPSLVVPPRTWLARVGWTKHDLLRADEVPAGA